MSDDQHIIRSVKVEISCRDENTGQKLSAEFSNFWRDEILPGLDKLFKQFANGRSIRFEKLQIDIGNIPKENWEREFKHQFLEQVKGKLEQEKSTKIPEGIESSEIENFISRFFFFLDHGRFPWWAENQNLDELQKQLLAGLENEAFPIKIFKENLKSLFLKNPNAAQRFVLQFSLPAIRKIGHFIIPDEILWKQILKLEKSIRVVGDKSISKSFKEKEQFISIFWRMIFEEIAETEQPIDSKQFKLNVISKLLLYIKKRNPEFILMDLFTVLKSELPEVDLINIKKKVKIAPEIFEPEAEPSPDKKREFEEEKTDDEITDDAIYIQNAGIVILHPFLVELFESLELIENERFVSMDAQYEAEHMLRYLIWGNEIVFENELMLNKILCGLPLNMPVDRKLTISQDSKKIAGKLLKAVLNHWPALKTDSTEALQVNFFKRAGKLSKREDGNWQLQVETKTMDILLNQLPWGIGILKLPWMKKMLFVDWI